ncbi:ribbon-helix-helix protein, CopG family [Desulfonatronum parangueonense]
MISVRLPRELELKLENLARQRHTSKTELIRTALERFFMQEESEKDSYELGEAYFGRYGSGDGTYSATYKEKLKKRINAKHHPR